MAMEHKHLMVRAKVENAPGDERTVIKWLLELVNIVDGDLLGAHFEPFDAGFTAIVTMEMAHITLHLWNSDPQLVQLDVYVCDSLEPTDVFDHLEQWGILTKSFMFIDRENTIQRIT